MYPQQMKLEVTLYANTGFCFCTFFCQKHVSITCLIHSGAADIHWVKSTQKLKHQSIMETVLFPDLICIKVTVK